MSTWRAIRYSMFAATEEVSFCPRLHVRAKVPLPNLIARYVIATVPRSCREFDVAASAFLRSRALQLPRDLWFCFGEVARRGSFRAKVSFNCDPRAVVRARTIGGSKENVSGLSNLRPRRAEMNSLT